MEAREAACAATEEPCVEREVPCGEAIAVVVAPEAVHKEQHQWKWMNRKFKNVAVVEEEPVEVLTWPMLTTLLQPEVVATVSIEKDASTTERTVLEEPASTASSATIRLSHLMSQEDILVRSKDGALM